MRYRLLASYQGAPYEAGIGPGESGVVLFAACPPPEDLHFEPATGHWRKTVRRGEVQSLYESRPVGVFRGEPCVVLDDLTDRLHIAYLGHDALKAEQLGYWEVDRGVFELIAPRPEVSEVVEQRLPIAGQDDTGSHTAPLANGSAPDAGAEMPSPYPAPGHAADGPGSAAGPGGSGGSGAPGYSASRSGYGSQAQNGHRPGLLPPDTGRGTPSDGQDRLAGISAPWSADLPGHGRGGSGSPDQASSVSIPAAESPPLPLEAQAMRAASAASRRAKEGHSGRDEPGLDADQAQEAFDRPPAETAPAIPLTPAGLSEPSPPGRAPGAGSSAMPSWTPHPHVPPQRPAQSETGLSKSAAEPGSTPAVPDPGRAPAAGADPARSPYSTAARAGTAGQADQADQADQLDQDDRSTGPGVDQEPGPGTGSVRPAAAAEPPADPTDTPTGLIGIPAGLGYGVRPAARYGEPGGTAARNGNHGRASAQALADAPPLDPYRQDRPEPPGLESPAAASPAGAPPTLAPPPSSRTASSGGSPTAPVPPVIPVPPVTAVPLEPPDQSVQPPAPDRRTASSPVDGTIPPAGSAPLARSASAAGYAPQAAPLTSPLTPVPPPSGQLRPASPTASARPERAPDQVPLAAPAAPTEPRASGRRRSAKRRLPTQRIFSDLAAQAGIAPQAYAIGEDVEGAMCLVQTRGGYEVFNSLGGARHEVRAFADEESAYFYLFGVLAAEAVRTGTLGMPGPRA